MKCNQKCSSIEIIDLFNCSSNTKQKNELTPAVIIDTSPPKKRPRPSQQILSPLHAVKQHSESFPAYVEIKSEQFAINDTSSAGAKYLEDFNTDDIANLVRSKGPNFQKLATELQDASFEGSFIAKELDQSDMHFMDTFLLEFTGLKSRLRRLSVLRTFQKIPRKCW
mmetsp:Transcript_63684/g.76538  ORF Transcript_63684/g.76538 Transcript_63684/m.76538 type:complete len:167 (-) Transcript_63684:4-504(-)